MPQHSAVVEWHRNGEVFSDNKYSRAHEWHFDGGASVAGSASPDIVPLPYSDEAAVDPEEAFVASLSSCHMLWFLDLSRQAGFIIDHYKDEAVGKMTKKQAGVYWISRVELHPKVVWHGTPPADETLQQLHDKAHHHCFIANSVKTEVVTIL